MSSQSFKLFLVAVAVVALSILAWQPWESGQAHIEIDTPSGSVDDASQSEAVVAQASAQRSAVQREFLVVDENGSPVAGAELRFCGIDDNAEMRNWIARAIDDPSVIDTGFFRASDLVGQTDDQGKVWLSDKQAGVAFATTANAVGVIAFLGYAGSESALRIQLETHAVLTVSVMDALGRAAPNVPVNISYSTKESRALRVPSARLAKDIRWRRLGENQFTDENGQVLIPIDGFLGAHIVHVKSEDGAEFRVNADLPFELAVHEQVYLNEASRVELQLAEAGGLRLFMWGNGLDLRPRVSLAENAANGSWAVLPIWPVAQEEGSTGWLFPFLPLNKKLQVEFYRPTSRQADGSTWTSTALPAIAINGPTLLGEVENQKLQAPTGVILKGRVVDENGDPILRVNPHDNGISIRVRESADSNRTQYLQVEHLEEGRFEARLQRGSQREMSLDQYSEAFISYKNRREMEVVAGSRRWAHVEIDIDEGAAEHDLGDVILARNAPVLKVTVLDEMAVPIPSARVHFSRSVQSRDGLSVAWEQVDATFFGGPRKTDQNGVFFLTGFDRGDAWKTLTHRQVELSECRVTVGHEDFLTQVVEFQIEQEELTVTLKRAETLRGEVLCPRIYRSVDLALVDAGSDIRDPDFIHQGLIGQIRSSIRKAGTDPNLVPFELKTLKPGEQDLVVFTTESRVELARIPGIDPAQIDALNEPIDLTDKIGLARLTLLDQAGELIRAESVQGAGGPLWIRERGWPSGSSGTGVEWDQDEVLVPIYANSGYPGALTMESEGSIPLSRLKAGSWTMQFAPAQTVRVRYLPPHPVPLGATLSARWQARDGFERITPMSGDAECDVKFELQAGTNFTVTWTLTDAEGKRLGGARELIEITDKHVASNEVIEVPVPLSVFEG